MIRRMDPPLPAASRPSKTTATRAPSALDPVLHLDQLGLQSLQLFLVHLPVQPLMSVLPLMAGQPNPAERREHGEVSELVRGQLLVATPDLRDPNFSRTVVLMLEHGADGALGVVLNRPIDLRVADVLPDWADLSRRPRHASSSADRWRPRR